MIGRNSGGMTPSPATVVGGAGAAGAGGAGADGVGGGGATVVVGAAVGGGMSLDRMSSSRPLLVGGVGGVWARAWGSPLIVRRRTTGTRTASERMRVDATPIHSPPGDRVPARRRNGKAWPAVSGCLRLPLPRPQAGDPLLDGRVGREQVGELHLAAAQGVDDVLRRLRGVDRSSGSPVRLGRAWRAPGPAARRRAMSRAPVRSASNSRLRLSAIWRTAAASGARRTRTSRASGLGLSSSPPPPPNMAPHMAMRATKVMPMATAAATEPMRMSRLPTWLSSWASTPRSSSQSRTLRMPLRDCHRGVLGVAAGGEGVGLEVGRHVERRHRHARLGA